jgi:mono/diheme cytochrome c family protein
MKSLLLPFAGILLVVAVTAGNAGRLWSQDQTPAAAVSPAPAAAPAQAQAFPKNPVKPTAESQTKAKQLYARDCAMCHGDNGNGKTDLATSMNVTLTDWSDPKSLQNQCDGELFNVIRNGKGDKMPPEGDGRAKDDAVWNLVIYIRTFSKGSAAAAPATTADSH